MASTGPVSACGVRRLPLDGPKRTAPSTLDKEPLPRPRCSSCSIISRSTRLPCLDRSHGVRARCAVNTISRAGSFRTRVTSARRDCGASLVTPRAPRSRVSGYPTGTPLTDAGSGARRHRRRTRLRCASIWHRTIRYSGVARRHRSCWSTGSACRIRRLQAKRGRTAGHEHSTYDSRCRRIVLRTRVGTPTRRTVGPTGATLSEDGAAGLCTRADLANSSRDRSRSRDRSTHVTHAIAMPMTTGRRERASFWMFMSTRTAPRCSGTTARRGLQFAREREPRSRLGVVLMANSANGSASSPSRRTVFAGMNWPRAGRRHARRADQDAPILGLGVHDP